MEKMQTTDLSHTKQADSPAQYERGIYSINRDTNYFAKFESLQKHAAQLSGPYCAGVLAIASMDSHLFGFNLMGISQPRCSTISTLFRHWFIEGNTHFGGEHFLIKTLKKTWFYKKLQFFLYPRFLRGFCDKLYISNFSISYF